MAATVTSERRREIIEEVQSPQSPGADYGLQNGFDPAKYDFYNPISHRAKWASAQCLEGDGECSVENLGLEEEEAEGEDGNYGEEEQTKDQSPGDHYDPGTPEPLSPIEELDDEVQSIRPVRRGSDSDLSCSLMDEPVKSTGTIDSGHASLDERTRLPLSLEQRTELLFSRQHLQAILADRGLATKFATFLRIHRPNSVPILAYYLDAIKALKTIRYAECIIRGLEPIPGHAFTTENNSATMAWVMEDKADRALDALVKDDMPAFVAYMYVRTVDVALVDRVTKKQDSVASSVAEGLAEVFVLSDPARPDNPIVFTSDEFHIMTGWSRKEFLGQNCRILGGGKTSPFGIRRFQASVDAKREHCEVLLNYRRDGSPFINLIMCVPLRDKTNRVRYYLGAQLDITGLVNSHAEFTSFRQVVEQAEKHSSKTANSDIASEISIVDEFAELSQLFSAHEFQKLAILQQQRQAANSPTLSQETEPNSGINRTEEKDLAVEGIAPTLSFYQNYLLVRPHPSLRILFASPGLRNVGILQQPLMKSIGGSARVRQDLEHALEMGRKVTAKVKWLSTASEPAIRWIHCTPLLGVNDSVGVWMVILVDAELDGDVGMDNEVAEPKVRYHAKGGNYASDPIPWDTMIPRPNNNIGVSTAIWSEGGSRVQEEDEIVLIKSKGARGGPVSEKAVPSSLLTTKAGPSSRAVDQASSSNSHGERRTFIDDEFSIGGIVGKQGSLGNRPLSRDERPLTGEDRLSSSDSARVPIHTQLRPTIRIAGRPSFETPKPAPINLPGPPRPNAADDPDGLRPVRKRTYKSLSPYGILFDG